MLHRREGESLVLIPQPAHAWISGQLANAWGNPSTGIEPVSLEVRLAAEQHDIAWLGWEAMPTLNPDTGLPHSFSQLPTLEHLEVWSNSTPHALSYGYLPAVLISMHGTYLYERFHDYDSDTDEEVAAAKAFLRREGEFQREALARIEASHGLSEEQVRQLRQLVSAWDAMSLALCLGAPDGREFEGLPVGEGPVDFAMQPLDDALTSYSMTPWPFREGELRVRCEGRRIAETFTDTESMRAALRAAPTVGLEISLVAG